jgi:hypothetical protein
MAAITKEKIKYCVMFEKYQPNRKKTRIAIMRYTTGLFIKIKYYKGKRNIEIL